VAELTHHMETLLDKLRRHELQPTAAMVDVLLASGDALKDQLAVHQGLSSSAPDTAELLNAIAAFVAGQTPSAPEPAARPAAAAAAPAAAPAASAPMTPSAPATPAAPAAAPAGRPQTRALELRVGPLPDVSVAEALVDLFKEITDLGSIEPLDAGRAEDGVRRFKVITATPDSELIDLFGFHVAREQVQLLPLGPGLRLPRRRARRAADTGSRSGLRLL
jgi:two-component system, chemotaxis family, sensor kinase CheA